ncbi:Predicted Zn-dependent protease [Blastococcus sp. DSM 46786]|uniref:matrixin family metalloprotease n=1 Tax=Blastococcus sp. DSM 46786 TaxID=1798227 RepID=UPI0008AE5724|nr:matrixin family metalloprotease [Blastococcus sp. DSM 46786]SEL24501.1 Predicted Zn-dependent protease [Blastococcus sp. DSM 46786]
MTGVRPEPPEDTVRLPVSASGRTPQWLLDELAGAPGPASSAPLPAPRRGRRGRWGVPLVVAAVVGGAVLADPPAWPWAEAPAAPGAAAPLSPAVPARPTDRPTPSGAATPLGRPPLPPAVAGSYAYAALQEDGVTPVAYDPCREIRYVLRPDAAPPGTEALVHEAVARIGAETGLRFVYDGPTDEPMGGERAPFQPDRYGDRWAPVLIGWQTEAEDPTLAGDVVGAAGSTAVSLGDGPRVYVTGTVTLDAGQAPDLLAEPGGATALRSVLLHELGHLVGLSHVDDDRELMYPEARRAVPDFADGDRTGLTALGQGPCVPEL